MGSRKTWYFECCRGQGFKEPRIEAPIGWHYILHQTWSFSNNIYQPCRPYNNIVSTVFGLVRLSRAIWQHLKIDSHLWFEDLAVQKLLRNFPFLLQRISIVYLLLTGVTADHPKHKKADMLTYSSRSPTVQNCNSLRKRVCSFCALLTVRIQQQAYIETDVRQIEGVPRL